MTARFGQGYGSMGYGQTGFGGIGFGSQPFEMGPSALCPTCGFQGGYPMTGMPQFMGGMTPPYGFPGYSFPQGLPWYGPTYPWSTQGYPGFPQTYPGAMQGFYPGYQAMTFPDDEQIREMIYDALDADPLVPFDSDINVEVTGGLVTLAGTVPNKRIKHAVGDDAWWIPGVWDVNNQLEITGRARARAERPTEGMPTRRTTETTPTRQRPRRPAGQA